MASRMYEKDIFEYRKYTKNKRQKTSSSFVFGFDALIFVAGADAGKQTEEADGANAHDFGGEKAHDGLMSETGDAIVGPVKGIVDRGTANHVQIESPPNRAQLQRDPMIEKHQTHGKDGVTPIPKRFQRVRVAVDHRQQPWNEDDEPMLEEIRCTLEVQQTRVDRREKQGHQGAVDRVCETS